MKSFSRNIHSTGGSLAETLDNLVWSVRGTLRAASFGYGAAIRVRAAAYRCVPFSRHRVNAHVVSVGNITVGGTGKTPVTEYVARRYVDAGRRVAILSRGYGRPVPSRDVVVVSGGDGLLEPDWRRTGDEPQLLARNVPRAAVLVCADRVRSARMAVAEYGADVIVLDDGFQHMRLGRNEDIVVLDATQPLDSLHLLPRGTLREPPGALRRATMIVLTHADRCESAETAMKLVRRYAPKVPIVCTRHQTTAVRQISGSDIQSDLAPLAGRRVVAFSAIGNPAGFEHSVASAGADIVHTLRFADHHTYTDADIAEIGQAIDQHAADAAVTTEKDAVRLPGNRIPFPAYSMGVTIDLINNSIWPE